MSRQASGSTESKTYFEAQRELLLRDVGTNMEQVLQNINTLNRSLEAIIAVGNEFSSVEALWSHFENIMAKDPDAAAAAAATSADANTASAADKDATSTTVVQGKR